MSRFSSLAARAALGRSPLRQRGATLVVVLVLLLVMTLLGLASLRGTLLEERILRAAELAGVSQFAGKHPKGFDMEIGEQGRGLSGGQRQSVARARALLHDPPILILDEPSSSMDNRTETRLKTNLKNLLAGKTLVLITHRGSLLDLVERIIIIDNGAVVADGPRDQVLSAMKSGQIAF